MSYSKKDFAEQELNILRKSVDNIQQNIGKKILNDPNVKQIIEIVEDFLRKKKLICYGGTAINNILPEQDQFYNKDVELPDYDFFSPHALEDAKELAEIYYKAGFEEVEAKAGVHAGTFKVFVNFIPVADVTQLVKEIYGNLKREAIKIDGILYCPPNYLRMSMYLELSRPKGDVSRWEKVLKRLTLLNKHYPLRTSNCKNIEIQRLFSSYDKVNSNDLFYITRDILINNGVIFFGALAHKLYTKYNKNNSIATIPDFDVLSTNPKRTAEILKERLTDYNFKNVRIVKKPGIGEIIAPHYEVKVGKNAIAFIYKPIACHSYNTHQLKEKTVKIASIDTMLSFYLAFLYSNRPYYEDDRILCMAQYLFNVQQKNRLKQQGLLKRFGIECYGEQETIEKMRAEKTNKFKELKNDRNSKEYQKYFLKYIPGEKKSTKKITTKKTTNKKTTNKKTTNKKTKSKSSNKKTNKNKVPFTD